MKALLLAPVLVLAGLLAAQAAPSAAALPVAPPLDLEASGTFTQEGITDLDVHTAGGTTILDQTSFGTVSGTLDGTFDDSLHVVIRPNGTFSASFQLVVSCTVDGVEGVVTLQANDVGRLVDSTTAEFFGIATIIDATDGLDGLRGVLTIQGTVDLTTGLSTYSYDGTLRQGS